MNHETEEQRQNRLWEWYRIFNGFDLKFEWFPEVVVTEALVDNIYNQLISLKNNLNVFFLPGDRDKKLWEACFPQRKEIQEKNRLSYKKTEDYTFVDYHGTGMHHDDHIIGKFTEANKNVYGYIDPKIPDVFVKIQIEDRFQSLPLRAYGLHVGLDCDFTKFKPNEDVMNFKHEIESCKLKGLYFRELDNSNNADNSLSNYYGLRGLGMFIYVPGRAYY